MFGFGDDEAASGRQLRRIEAKLDAIIAHLGARVPEAGGLSEEARLFADTGQTIAAIKQHREDTGAGLAEAKQAVEEYLRGR
jgi:ribosomal protein L7/L12